MFRRKFLKDISSIGIGSLAFGHLTVDMTKFEDVIVGHGTHRYKIDMSWGALNSHLYPVNDCHEMVQDSRGRIVLLTNHVRNNVIIYDKKGKLNEVWGTEFPGAHGLTLNVEGDEDFLYIADNERHEVIKTTIDGKIVQIFSCPLDSGHYDELGQFVPTETAVADNGDVYLTDGYGLQNILHYNSKGELLNVFGGKGTEEKHLDNAHGICVDNRNEEPSLLVTDRMKNKLKRFSMQGELLSVTHLPGAYICRPVMHGENVFLATIWSGEDGREGGFVSILDRENKMISAPCGSRPVYKDGQLKSMHQTLKVFQHPHDVCVDDEENLYVAQWNSGRTYPIKLFRV